MLEVGAVVEGSILTADGEPVIQASITVAEQHDGVYGLGHIISAGGQSDVEGNYRVDGAPTGSATVTVFQDAHQRLMKTIEVRPGTNIVDLVLDRGFEVTGQVVSADGTPMGGAAITMQQGAQGGVMHFGTGSPQAMTKADGTFVLADVAPGNYTVAASRDGFAPAKSEAFEVAGNVSGLLLELTRGATLKGRIVGLEFDELGSLNLVAFSQQGGMLQGQVDFSGEYVFESLAAGDWHVQAQVTTSGRMSMLQVEVPEGVGEVSKDIEFGTGFSLDGIVLDGDQPLAGANVTVSGTLGSSGFSATGTDGRFRIEALKAGTYQVMVMAGMGIQHTEILELTGDHELRIEMATGAVVGFVRDVGGDPIAGASVTLERLDVGEDSLWSRQFGFGNRVETDSRGYFNVPKIRQGNWRAVASKSGYAPGEVTLAVLGGSSPEVEIRMAPTEAVSFDVLMDSGASLQSVQILIFEPSGRRLTAGTHPVVDGKVRVSTVPPGHWDLVVQGGESAATRFAVNAPGDQGRLVLPTAGMLQIRVPELEDVPIASMVLTGPDGRPFVATMGFAFGPGEWVVSGGQTMVPSLTPGVWTFTITNDDRTWTGSATVTPGATTEVVVP